MIKLTLVFREIPARNVLHFGSGAGTRLVITPELDTDWMHPWIGLDWIGLDWIGSNVGKAWMDWIGLDCDE